MSSVIGEKSSESEDGMKSKKKMSMCKRVVIEGRFSIETFKQDKKYIDINWQKRQKNNCIKIVLLSLCLFRNMTVQINDDIWLLGRLQTVSKQSGCPCILIQKDTKMEMPALRRC